MQLEFGNDWDERLSGLSYTPGSLFDGKSYKTERFRLFNPAGWGRNVAIHLIADDSAVRLLDQASIVTVFGRFATHNDVFLSVDARTMRFGLDLGDVNAYSPIRPTRITDQDLLFDGTVAQPGVVDLLTRQISFNPLIVRSSGMRAIYLLEFEITYEIEDVRKLRGLSAPLKLNINGVDVLEFNLEQLGLNEPLPELDETVIDIDTSYASVDILNGFLRQDIRLFQSTGPGIAAGIVLHYTSSLSQYYKAAAREPQDQKCYWFPFGQGWSWNYGARVLGKAREETTISTGSKDHHWRLVVDPFGRVSAFERIGTTDVFRAYTRGCWHRWFNLADHQLELTEHSNGFELRAGPHSDVWLFDDEGRLIEMRARAYGRPLQIAWSGSGATVTDSSGRRTEIQIVNDLVQSVRGPGGETWRFQYVGPNLAAIDAPDGQLCGFGYHDDHYMMTTLTNGLGATSTYVYNEGDKINERTRWGTLRSAETVGPDIQTARHVFVYRNNSAIATGFTLQHTDPRNFTSSYVVSLAASGTSINAIDITAHGATGKFEFSADWELMSMTDAMGKRTSIGVDITTGIPVDVAVPGGARTAYFNRGPGPRRIGLSVDPLNKQVSYEYVSVGGAEDLLSRMVSPNPFTGSPQFIVEYDYIGPGDMSEERESNGEITSFQYSATAGYLGLPIKLIRCVGGDEVQERNFEYSAYGWLKRLQYSDHEVIWDRDPLGNVREYRETESGQTAWTRHEYNPQGLIRRSIHSSGGEETFVHDAAGRVKVETSTGADGITHQATCRYDAAGNMTEMTSPAGTVMMTYTSRGDLETVRMPDNTGTDFRYNLRGDIIEEIEIDAAGQRHVTGNEVDDNARVTKITHPAVARSDGSGGTWRPTIEFKYFNDGQVQTIKQELEPGVFSEKTYELDGMGRPYLARTTIPDEGDYEQLQLLDPTGLIEQTRGPIFTFSGMTVTAPIVVEGEDRANQFLRYFSHDCRDRITEIRDRNQQIVAQYEYSEADTLASVKTRDPAAPAGVGLITAQERIYEPDGRLSEVREPGGYVTGFDFDYASNATTVTEIGRGSVRVEDNAEGQVAKQSVSPAGAAGVESEFEYNMHGDVTVVRHRNSLPSGTAEVQEYGFDYNNLGRLERKTDPLSRAYQTGYDDMGRLNEARHQGDGVRYRYDALGRLVEKTQILSGETATYAYDGHGNMTFADNAVATCRWRFDTVGRITSRQLHFKAAGVTKSITYQYDKFGLLAAREDSDGSKLRYRYDAEDRMTELFLDDDTDEILRHEYYDWGGLERTVLRGGLNSIHTYGQSGKIQTIRHTIYARDYSKFDYARASDRRVTSIARTGDIRQHVALAYDGAGRLRRQVSDSPTTVLEEDYTWDGVGNLRAVSHDGMVGSADYDLANQLTRWNESQVTFVDPAQLSASASSSAQGYQAGAAINDNEEDRVAPGVGWKSASTDAEHRLTLETTQAVRISGIDLWFPTAFGPVEGLVVELRQAGSAGWTALTSAVVIGGALGSAGVSVTGRRARLLFVPADVTGVRLTRPVGKGFTQAASPADRIILAVQEVRLFVTTGSSFNCTHDGFGSMTRNGSLNLVHDVEGRLTRLTGPGVDLERQFGPDGRLAVTIDHQAGTTTLHMFDGVCPYGDYRSSGEPIRRYLTAPLRFVPFGFVDGAAPLSQSPVHLYLVDERNSVIHVVRETNLLENTYVYDVWGNTLDAQETISQPIGFMGARRIGSTNLYDLGQRVYDPGTRRFLERDPVPSGPNPYAAFRCDPVNLADPLGTSFGDWFDSIVETVKELPGVLYEDFASGSAAQRLRAFGSGFVKGTVAAVESTVHAVTHPIETAEAAVTAILNFDQVLEALEAQWDELVWQAANDPEAFAETLGRFIGELEAGLVIGAGTDKLKAMAKVGDMAAGLQRRVRMLRNSVRQPRRLPMAKCDHTPTLQSTTPVGLTKGAAKGPAQLKRKRRRRGPVSPQDKQPPNLKLPRGNFRAQIRRHHPVSKGFERRHKFADRGVRGWLSMIANKADDPVKMLREMNKARNYADFPPNISVYNAARKLQLNIFNDPKNFFVGPAAPNQALGRALGHQARPGGRGVNIVAGPVWDPPPCGLV
jgi:RHS repeat-associated protein